MNKLILSSLLSLFMAHAAVAESVTITETPTRVTMEAIGTPDTSESVTVPSVSACELVQSLVIQLSEGQAAAYSEQVTALCGE
jgi:hypothetical protein